MGVNDNIENNIEWIIANEKITFWNIFYIGIPLNFIVLFFIFYFVVFPFSSSLISAVVIYVIIATISSIISSVFLFISSLWVYPSKIGFTSTNLFYMNKWGKVRKYKIDNITNFKKKNNKSIRYLRENHICEIRVDSKAIDSILHTFNSYKL